MTVVGMVRGDQRGTRYLIAHFAKARELSDALRSGGPAGILRLRMRGRIAPRAPVVVEVAVPELSRHLLLRGTVEEYVGTRHHLVDVALAEREVAKREFMLALARGAAPPEKRRFTDRRFPIDGVVEISIPDQSGALPARIVDLSLRGARLRPQGRYEVDDPILVNIPLGETPAPRIVTARVVWTRESASGQEIGVTFRTRDRSGVRRTREIVRRRILASLERAPKPTSLGLGPK